MGVKKQDLIDKLKEAEIEFEDSAKVDDLRGLLSDEEYAALEAEVETREAAEKQAEKDGLIKCVILRDTWDEDGNRHKAGTEVNLPAEAAIDGVENGVLSRVKK